MHEMIAFPQLQGQQRLTIGGRSLDGFGIIFRLERTSSQNATSQRDCEDSIARHDLLYRRPAFPAASNDKLQRWRGLQAENVKRPWGHFPTPRVLYAYMAPSEGTDADSESCVLKLS
jgi:hypothetical protein